MLNFGCTRQLWNRKDYISNFTGARLLFTLNMITPFNQKCSKSQVWYHWKSVCQKLDSGNVIHTVYHLYPELALEGAEKHFSDHSKQLSERATNVNNWAFTYAKRESDVHENWNQRRTLWSCSTSLRKRILCNCFPRVHKRRSKFWIMASATENLKLWLIGKVDLTRQRRWKATCESDMFTMWLIPPCWVPKSMKSKKKNLLNGIKSIGEVHFDVFGANDSSIPLKILIFCGNTRWVQWIFDGEVYLQETWGCKVRIPDDKGTLEYLLEQFKAPRHQ